MNTREVLNAVLPAIGKTQADMAASIGKTPQQLSQRMVCKTLRTDDFLEAMENLGIEVIFKVKETGEIVKFRKKGHGRRLKGMADHVRIDTAAADALSNSFYADGVNEYDSNGEAQELYVDTEGKYFMAEYNAIDPAKDRIRSVPAHIAAAFIEKFGTEIEKNN